MSEKYYMFGWHSWMIEYNLVSNQTTSLLKPYPNSNLEYCINKYIIFDCLYKLVYRISNANNIAFDFGINGFYIVEMQLIDHSNLTFHIIRTIELNSDEVKKILLLI